MKIIKRWILAGLVLLGLFFQISCSDSLQSTQNQIPYSNEEELSALKDVGYVNYKVSRYFANLAMNDFANENGWQNARLSDYPVIIYSAVDDTPRYYEFRVIKDGKEVGAVSCTAKEKEGSAVQYVLPYTLEIQNASIVRQVAKDKSHLVDTNYPSKITVKDFALSRSVDSEGNEVSDEYQDVSVIEILDTLSEEELEELGINEQSRAKLLEEQESLEKEIADYWDFIKKNESIILATSDEEIAKAYEEIYATENARSVTSTKVYSDCILPEWEEKVYWHNPKGWCGPNCVTFIALGLGTDSGCEDVPLCNNASQIKNLYEKFLEEIGEGARLFGKLSDGLSKYTDYKIVTDFGHLYSTISNNVRTTGLPSISLRSSKGLSAQDIQWHYRTVVGVKDVLKTTIVTAFGKEFFRYSKKIDKYYVMHDNGVDGNSKDIFYESSFKLYHFWSAHVEEK